mmetsp:Transcript_25086/g.70271  ORF Transcript_25086/g.70271 Transcript_25086/m.70271 type:complete len:324 (+) Transcript_25086:102-1073(+)
MEEEHDEGVSNATRLFAVVYYMTCAILLTILNKILFAVFGFADPLLLAFAQLVSTGIILFVTHALDLISLPAIRAQHVRAVFPLSLLYMGMLASGLAALRLTDLVMYNSLRRTGVVLVLVCQYFVLGTVPSRQVFVAVGLIAGGTLVAAANDLSFNMGGYMWALLCNMSTALYIVLIKWVKERTSLSAYGILFYNTFLCLPFCAVALAVMGYQETFWERPLTFWMSFSASSVMGFFINHSIFYNTAMNSPLTQSVAGQMKGFILLVCSFGFDYKFDPLNFVGVLSSFAGSMVYAHGRVTEVRRKEVDPSDDGSDRTGSKGQSE